MRTDGIGVIRWTVLTAAVLIAAATESFGQGVTEQTEASGGNVGGQLDQMKRQLDAMQRENQAMRSEIDDLRAKSETNWLTEARAEEIRGLVADVLADADTRSSLLQSGMTAGWSEHFFLADPNGRFTLFIDGAIQFRWNYNYLDRDPFNFFGDQDQHREGFELSRTRLTFRGHVFNEDMEYLVRTDFFGQRNALGFANLLDAWVRYNFSEDWSIRGGQFKLPFNREELVAPEMQLAVERSLVNEGITLGRSQGIELTYAAGPMRLLIATSDGASGGVAIGQLIGANRTNTPALAIDTEYDVTARFEHLFAGTWEQFSDFTSPPGDEFGMMIGVAGHAQESETTQAVAFSQTTTRNVAGTADLSIEWGGASFFISATHHYIDSPGAAGIVNVTGIVGQAGIYVAPKWEVFARGEYGQIAGDSGSIVDSSDLSLLTVGFNYYLEGHDLKWTTDFGITTEQLTGQLSWVSDVAGYRAMTPNTDVQIVFRTQFQLLF